MLAMYFGDHMANYADSHFWINGGVTTKDELGRQYNWRRAQYNSFYYIYIIRMHTYNILNV